MSEAISSLPTVSGMFGYAESLKSLLLNSAEELESPIPFVSWPAGIPLFVEEQVPSNVFILLDGQVKLYITSSEGRRVLLHVAKPGEVLELSSVLMGTPYQMTAETLYPCNIATLKRAQFLDFLTRYPAALASAVRELSLRHNRTCARLRTIVLTPKVSAKVARLLLEWCAYGRPTTMGTRIHIPFTHGEIGQCIGTTRETITRILGSFQRRGIVFMRGSILIIVDRSALERCAGI